jgi:hypothetical protein
MTWLDTLVSWFASFSNTAALWKYEASTWSWPLSMLEGFFIALSDAADGWFTGWLDFRTWLYNLADIIGEVTSWQSVIIWVESAIDALEAAVTWISSWSTYVGDLVSAWWDVVSGVVQDWIETATTGLAGMLEAWTDFVTNTLPTLFDLEYATLWWRDRIVEVGDLIASAFEERSDLWDGWSDFRQAVSEIVSSPFDWLEARFADWFLGAGMLWTPPPEVGEPHKSQSTSGSK